VELCEYHGKALEKLREAIESTSRTLNISRHEAITILASKKRSTGRWIIEVARKALEDPKLKAVLSPL